MLRYTWILLLFTVTTAKKDRNVFHGHRGKLDAYTPGPFDIQLSASEVAQLESGTTVMKQTMKGETGGAICVQDVNAPVQAVWHQILDLNAYAKKVSKVNVCQNYQETKENDNCFRIKTKQVLGVLPGYAYESYYDHTFHPKDSSLVWSLDYDKSSDFDDVAGHWHVQPLSASKSRVFYACDIQMKGRVPKPILNYISKAALRQATGWVKKESEQNPKLPFPPAYGQLEGVPAGGAQEEAAAPKRRRRRWGF